MHPERLQTLRLRYPGIYGNTLRTECGDGWFGILDALGEQLTRQAELERRADPHTSSTDGTTARDDRPWYRVQGPDCCRGYRSLSEGP